MGIISFVIFLIFLGWVVYQYCTCCCSAKCYKSCCSCKIFRKKNPAAAAASDGNFTQFIEEGKSHDAPDPLTIAEEAPAPPAYPSGTIDESSPVAKGATTADDFVTATEIPPAASKKKPRFTFTFDLVEKVLVAILTLGVFACSIWGIVASLTSTDSQISAVWDLVDTISMLIDNTSMAFTSLSGQLDTLAISVASIGNDSAALGGVLESVQVAQNVVTTAIAALQKGASSINDTQATINNGVTMLNDYLGDVGGKILFSFLI